MNEAELHALLDFENEMYTTDCIDPRPPMTERRMENIQLAMKVTDILNKMLKLMGWYKMPPVTFDQVLSQCEKYWPS